MKQICIALLTASAISAFAQESEKLSGSIIGCSPSVDYSTNAESTTVNTCQDAFDGNLDTYYASYERSLTWVGMDLETPHVITKVGWSPRNDGYGPSRVQLAVFEGANNADFSDALPIYMTTEEGTIGKMSYADVNVSRSFRYVRYVGPNNARCNVAEVEFYGYEGEGDDTKLYQVTNLPLVVVNVENSQMPQDKVTDLVSNVNIISNDGTKILTAPATFRLRGNASMTFPKKPYRIKFDKKQNVLDAPAKAKKWTLINNYGDKTLMRNILAFEISRRLGMEYTPYCQPVDVIVNGEYQGCYQLCDQIEVNSDRVNVEALDKKITDAEEITGGYLIEVDAYAYDEPEGGYFISKKGNPVTIKYPDPDGDISDEQRNYIANHFNKMEAAVYSSSKDMFDLLDINSFLQHFIVGEISGNTDTYWSTYMYKHRGDDHFYVGPVWDFDIAFDNDYRTYPLTDKDGYIYSCGSASHAGDMETFVSRIVKYSSTAKSALADMWKNARKDKDISAESITSFIRETATMLDASQKLNFKRWNIMNEGVHMNPVIWGSYAKEVEHVINYTSDRIGKIDQILQYDPTPVANITIDENQGPIEIYNLAGVLVAKGSTNNLPAGIYIIRQGNNVKKAVIK